MSGASSSKPPWSAKLKGYNYIGQGHQEASEGIIARFDFRKHTKKRVKSGGFSDFTRFIRVGRACARWGLSRLVGGSFRGGIVWL